MRERWKNNPQRVKQNRSEYTISMGGKHTKYTHIKIRCFFSLPFAQIIKHCAMIVIHMILKLNSFSFVVVDFVVVVVLLFLLCKTVARKLRSVCRLLAIRLSAATKWSDVIFGLDVGQNYTRAHTKKQKCILVEFHFRWKISLRLFINVVRLHCMCDALVICSVHSLCSIYDTIDSMRSSKMVACVVCSTFFTSGYKCQWTFKCS